MRRGSIRKRIMSLMECTAVIVPIEEDQELLQDLDDLAVIARRKNEPTIPLAEIKRRLKKNGAIRR